MPNWCKNNLRIIDNGEKVLEVLEFLKDDKGNMTFSKIAPMPEELKNTASPAREDTIEQKCLNEELKRKYGADNWYDWSIKNWGCKWDASESAFYKNGKYWIVTFQTPWGPPTEFLRTLSKKFKKMSFELQFADEGAGQFPLGESVFECGAEIFCDGPEEDTDEARKFAESVWDEEWVED